MQEAACTRLGPEVVRRTNRWFRRGGRISTSLELLLAALTLAWVLPAGAAPLQVPALETPESGEHHVGKVIFVELVTPRLAEAEQFYGALLGWTFREITTGSNRYATAFLGDQPVAGLYEKPFGGGERRQPAWLTFFAVSDVDGAKRTAAGAGAKVLSEPHNLPDRGREAVLADPQGAVFALLASKSGDPPDDLALPGEWIWSSLITSDADADAGFYQSIFDYEVYELPAEAGATHLILATDNYARASVNSLPSKDSRIRPHWLDYVRVDDALNAVAKVVALGGQVVVEPHVDRHGGRIAVVADPSGAPFGLMEWPAAETKEVSQ